MKHSIDLLESKLKEKTEEINFALRHRKRDWIRNKVIEAIHQARDYKKALKILKLVNDAPF